MPQLEFKISDTKPLIDKLHRLMPAVADGLVEAVNSYLITELRKVPPYKHISRTAAYGQPFQSDKQRRWFFWALNGGMIDVPYKRTGELSGNWKTEGEGYQQKIINSTPWADFVQGPGQSRMMSMIGWKKIEEFIQLRWSNILRVAGQGVDAVIRKLGLAK